MKSTYLLNPLALFMLIALCLCLTCSTVSGKDKTDDLIMTDKQKEAIDTGSLDTYSKDKWMQRRKVLERFVPQVGETTPDFKLSDLQGKNEVQLRKPEQDKPIVLIFGSYT